MMTNHGRPGLTGDVTVSLHASQGVSHHSLTCLLLRTYYLFQPEKHVTY